MQTLELKVRAGVTSEEREVLLREISAMKGVIVANDVYAGSKNADINRMCIMRIDDEADIDDLRDRLQAFEQIEAIAEPPQRWLSLR